MHSGDTSKISLLVAAVIATCSVVGFQSTFLPSEKEITISLRAIQNVQSISQEVWLTDVIVGSENVSLSELTVVENSGWTYNSDYDDYVYYPSENDDNILTLRVFSSELHLRFAQNSWSGSVEIINSDSQSAIINLQSETSSGIYHIINDKAEYPLHTRIFLSVGAIAIVCFTIYILLAFALKKCFRNGKRVSAWTISTPKNRLICLILLLFCLVSVFAISGDQIIDLYDAVSMQESLDSSLSSYQALPILAVVMILGIIAIIALLQCVLMYFLKNAAVSSLLLTGAVFVLIFSATFSAEYQYAVVLMLGIVCTYHLYQNEFIYVQAYLKKKVFVVLILLVSLYAAFAIFGYELFLKGAFWDTSFRSIIAFVNVWVFVVPLILAAIELLERTGNRFRHVAYSPTKLHIRRFQWSCFAVVAASLIITCVIFYPANMGYDEVYQWLQAMGRYQINNSHPAAHTLFLRLSGLIYPNPISATIAQSLLLSYVISSIMTFFYSKGTHAKLLIIISVIYTILPNTISVVTCPSKNVLFAILMLWLSFLLIRIFDDPKAFFSSVWLVTQFVVAAALTYSVRHNAFVILPVIIVILLYVTIKHFKSVKLKPVICACCSAALIVCISGPIYDCFEVDRNQFGGDSSTIPLISLITPYSAAISYDVPLSEDTVDYLEQLLPLGEFKERYDPYNSDTLRFSDPILDYTKTTTGEALQYYLKLFVQRPDIVIKSRLDGTNLIWDVFSHEEVWSTRAVIGIETPTPYVEDFPDPALFISERKVNDNFYSAGDGIAALLSKYISAFDDAVLLDSLIWRNGIYIIAMLLTLIIALKRRLFSVFLVHMVSLAVLVTLMLIVGWQIYRYIYFFPLCVTLCVAYELFHMQECSSKEQMKLL